MRRPLGALLLALLLAASARAAPRTVAVGDIHGAYDELQAILRRAGLIDAERRWIGGDAVLVQTGDTMDRGADVRQVIELLMDLERQAAAAGGRVHALLGNHEGMNLLSVYRDVGREAYGRFADAGSEKLRARAFKELKQLLRRRSSTLGLPPPQFVGNAREVWMDGHPPGLLEYHAAIGPDGELGAWLRRHDTVVLVGDSLFLHGGLSPELATLPLDEINRRVREEIATLDGYRRTLVDEGVILPFFDFGEMAAGLREYLSLAEAAAPTPQLAERSARLRAIQDAIARISDDWLVIAPEGPLWFRGYADWTDELLAPLVEPMLERLGARRVVTGHNPRADGRIQSRLDGRLFLIDTGMLGGEFYSDGRPSALEIDGDTVRRLYADEPAEPAGALLPRGALLPAEEPPETAAGRGAVAYPAPAGGMLPFDDDDRVLEFLATAPIVDRQPIGEGITQPFRFTLSDGAITLHAVHHDHDIERRGPRRSGGGLLTDFRDSYRNQIAGYEVARLLALDNVPPAVLRMVDGRPSSLALWIEGGVNEHRLRADGKTPPDPTDYARRLADVRVFDNLINNIDRNQTNIVIDEREKIWMVDHTRAFGTSPHLPNPDLVTKCSRPLWQAIRRLDPGRAEARLRPVLGKQEIRAMFKRREHLVGLLEERIARLGEERVLFVHGAREPAALPETGRGSGG